jgi:hypothetical protein
LVILLSSGATLAALASGLALAGASVPDEEHFSRF